jgi:hypothetical protein
MNERGTRMWEAVMGIVQGQIEPMAASQ